MKLILSTGNVSGDGSSSMGRPTPQKSNAELVNSLRANFRSAIKEAVQQTNSSTSSPNATIDHRSWTSMTATGDDKTLHVPAHNYGRVALQEEREQYDITLKLFFAPDSLLETRERQAREALQLIMEELGVSSVDLLIVSFAGVYFDESEDCTDKVQSRGPIESEPESSESQVATWRILEQIYDEKLCSKLGVSEFGSERLALFLEQVRIRPAVNQINLRDCCVLPNQLMSLATEKSIELLVHNDCSNILPKGTVRELLGCQTGGACVLADHPATSNGDETANPTQDGPLLGDVQPQWVVKYTAVVRDRGVVENKGYFAAAMVGG